MPEDLFERVQDMMKANKRAPAKHTEDEYILTTKLFCGKCKCLTAGESGTSHTGHCSSLLQMCQCKISQRV